MCSTPSDAEATPTKVGMEGGEELWVSVVGSGLDEWCSAALHMECRLVDSAGNSGRWVDGQPEQGEPINLQKAFPVHLVSQASLDNLNARLGIPVSMDRFRPNLIVSGTDPHEDDGWKRIQIGETVLQVGRACDHRCGVPNVDQETGERGVEPLQDPRHISSIGSGDLLRPEHRHRARRGTPRRRPRCRAREGRRADSAEGSSDHLDLTSARTARAKRHSKAERRYYALGTTDMGRQLFAVFTIRGDLIRLNSARDMCRSSSLATAASCPATTGDHDEQPARSLPVDGHERRFDIL